MSMLLFMLHGLWSIIDDSGSVVSSVVSSHPALLSFHMLAGNLDRARSPHPAAGGTTRPAAPAARAAPVAGARSDRAARAARDHPASRAYTCHTSGPGPSPACQR